MTSSTEPTSSSGRAPSEELDLARVRVDLATRVAGVTRLADLGTMPARRPDMAAIQPILTDLVEAMTRVVGAHGGLLHVYDAHDDALLPQAATASIGELADWPRVERGHGAAGMALERLAPVTIHLREARDVARDDALPAEAATTYATPMLTLTGEPMGVVSLTFAAPTQLDIGQAALVAAYAGQAAEMVERVWLYAEGRALLERDQRRSEQLGRLAEASSELMGELDLDGLLRAVTEAARAVIGSHQAVTSRLVRGWTEAVTYVSLSERYAEWRGYDRVPKGLGVLNFVTRENRSLRLTGDELRAHPDWRGLRDAPDHPPLPNYLAAPLVGRDGRNLGLIQLSDRAGADESAPGDFTPEDEHMLNLLARLASAALEDLELRERERAAGQRVDASARSLKLLADASRALAETLEVDATLATITSLAVPLLGDWCGVHLLDANGPVLAAHAGSEPAFTELMGGAVQSLEGADGLDVHGAVTDGETARHPSLPDAMLRVLRGGFPDRDIDPGTLLAVPLSAHGRRLGRLTLVRVPGPPYTAGEADLAEELGRRAALAVDNATRFASERDTALVLQRSMLPEVRREAGGLRVASRYLPGAEGLNVGGDWYDLVDLGDGRHGLVVGDVAGRGIAAAAVMGQLRAVVRAYALEGHPPARQLNQLDAFLRAQRTVSFVTCLYAVLDEEAGTLTAASAGHLPPLLLDDDGTRMLAVTPGPPLGSAMEPFGQTTTELRPGSTVLLYTDGLVEERSRPIDDGLALLCSAASRWRHSPEALCDGVLLTMSEDRALEDDTALLAISLARAPEPAGARERVRLELVSEPASARIARSQVAEILRAHAAEADVTAAELLVTEIVANAVRHAGGRRIELTIDIDERVVRVDVVDEGESGPVPGMPPTAEDPGGRGLMIVEALAARWGYEPDEGGGKRVWFELDRAA